MEIANENSNTVLTEKKLVQQTEAVKVETEPRKTQTGSIIDSESSDGQDATASPSTDLLRRHRPPRPQTVTLEKDKVYGFVGASVGYFRIRGGTTGNIWVLGAQVTIINSDGKTIFSGGGVSPSDLISLQDNWTGTTKVRLIPGQSSEDGKVVNHKVALLQGHHPEQQGPLQVVGVPGEEIILRGGTGRSVVITGTGGQLESVGSVHVTVYGSLENARHSGMGQLHLKGNITGNVTLRGRGTIYILGDVGGNVINQGTRLLQVYGKVGGNVEQYSSGGIVLHSNITGSIIQQTRGSIMIQGSVGGDITQTGNGSITLIGTHEGQVYQLGRGFIYCQLTNSETGIPTTNIHYKQC